MAAYWMEAVSILFTLAKVSLAHCANTAQLIEREMKRNSFMVGLWEGKKSIDEHNDQVNTSS